MHADFSHPLISWRRTLRLQHGGGGKPPGQSQQQKRNEKLQEKLMTAQLAQSQQKIEFPSFNSPPPVPPPPPPPSQSSADVTEAASAERRKALRRQSPGMKTILAGETGGYSPSLGGPKSILG